MTKHFVIPAIPKRGLGNLVTPLRDRPLTRPWSRTVKGIVRRGRILALQHQTRCMVRIETMHVEKGAGMLCEVIFPDLDVTSDYCPSHLWESMLIPLATMVPGQWVEIRVVGNRDGLFQAKLDGREYV